MAVQILQLANGFRIGVDQMFDVDSVTVSLAISIGSRHENKAYFHGIAHCLEHMAFKGTKKRTALEIAMAVDFVGGVMNAYTSKEKTVYYIKVLKEDLELAVDILSDIIQNSVFDPVELQKEQGVILQELAASQDTPDDVAFDKFFEVAYPDQPLGLPILGTKQTISAFTSDNLKEYIGTKYHAGNMVLSVAGNADPKVCFDLAEKYFTSIQKSVEVFDQKGLYRGGEEFLVNDDLSQTQYVLGYDAWGFFDERFYQLEIISSLLGGGMSSRLFQEIRENRGLVYTVSAFSNCFSDCGLFGIYAGTSRDKIDELHSVVLFELERAKNDILEEELQKIKNQYRASILMSRESTSSRSSRLASNILFWNKYITGEEILSDVEKVSVADVKNGLEEILSSKMTYVTYGPSS